MIIIMMMIIIIMNKICKTKKRPELKALGRLKLIVFLPLNDLLYALDFLTCLELDQPENWGLVNVPTSQNNRFLLTLKYGYQMYELHACTYLKIPE